MEVSLYTDSGLHYSLDQDFLRLPFLTFCLDIGVCPSDSNSKLNFGNCREIEKERTR